MLIEAKSNLARLMATENLIVEERRVETASFDIHSRILTVPILNGKLSPQLYDLLLGHEVGHALETPAEGWHNSITKDDINKSILNVCEDVRIEKKIKRRFPGLKPSFLRGYQELMEMDFFGVKDTDLNTLNFIDRVNLYTKGGAAQNISFTEEEKDLLREVESTETWKDVVAIARKIQKFMKAELENQEKTKLKIQIVSDGDADVSLTPEELQKLEENGIKIEDNTPQTETKKEEGGTVPNKEISKDQETAKNQEPVKGQESGGDSANSLESSIESKTDQSFREKEKSLYEEVSSNTKDRVYVNVPTLLLDKIVVPHKKILDTFLKYNTQNELAKSYFRPEQLRQNFVSFKNQSNKVVSYLVKEFELRKNAEQQLRIKVSKTGELNMNKIHEYKLTDDIFARLTKMPNGKSHGLVMFIDWSGSMEDKFHSTMKQLLNLVMFCKKVNIPFDVYGFTSNWFEADFYNNDSMQQLQCQVPKIGDLKISDSSLSLLNIFNHRMTAKEYTEMASYLLDMCTENLANCSIPKKLKLGGTPLNQAVVAAFDLIPQFKQKNKIDIVNAVFLTDGESSPIAQRYSHVDPHTRKMVSINDVRSDSRRRVIYRDPKTKACIEQNFSGGWANMAAEETITLLKLLKQRAECNIMGFYIASTREMRSAFELYAPNPHKGNWVHWSTNREYIDSIMSEFRKEKIYVIEKNGYDEYYFIGTNTLDTDDDEELTVNSTTVRGLVNAFSKYTGGKVNSRVILNRFIRMVA